MVLTDKDLAQIEDYFNDSLAEIDKNAFDMRLKTDAAFKKAVMSYQATLSVLNTVRTGKQKTFLKEIEATMPPFQLQKPVRRFQTTWWAMAAVGIALISVCIWVFSPDNEGGVKLKSPVAEYFEAYPALGITRGDETKDVVHEALRAYTEKDFKKSIPLLEQSFQINKDSLLIFYKGIAYLGNGQAAEAETILVNMQTSGKVPTESVVWYLALTYIELGQKEKAVILLKKTANTEGGYQAKAQSLLGRL